jgi:hypothetical protein
MRLKMESSGAMKELCAYGGNPDSGLCPYNTFVLCLLWYNDEHSGLQIQGSDFIVDLLKGIFFLPLK